MEQAKPYTIQFTYEIADDAIKFHLQADVTVRPNHIYVINNIRLAGKTSGSLIPSIALMKHEGSWIYTDSKKETSLSLAVGHAIDTHELAASSR